MFLPTIAALTLCQFVYGFPQTNVTNTIQDRDSSHSLNERSAKWLGYFSMTEDDLDSTRISGGSYADEGQFPFMAVVHRLLGAGKISQCGGTIIAPRWVLTAGHCIANHPRRYLVVFGVISKAGIGYDFYRGNGVSMITTKGALHPQYQQTVNDIGLLYMPRDIPYTATIQPIRLPSESLSGDRLTDTSAYVIGWGKDRSLSSGTQGLKYATLPIISNNDCSVYWSVTVKNICTAPGLGRDACQGDSGGPLMVMQNGEAVQIGIVSYGDSDCPSGRPGVFTRVSEYMPWIRSVTKIQF